MEAPESTHRKIHEAGHASVAIHEGRHFDYIVMEKDNDSSAKSETLDSERGTTKSCEFSGRNYGGSPCAAALGRFLYQYRS